MPPDVAGIEQELVAVAGSYDLLLQLTPTNGDEAFREFSDAYCERAPAFDYRRIGVDPDLLKRRLFALPIEEVDDPSLALVLAEQRDHLSAQLDMLAHRGTQRCLYASLHIYGAVDDGLLRQARELLDSTTDHTSERDQNEVRLDAHAFRVLAENEITNYQAQNELARARVDVRADVSSLTVSAGRLLVPEGLNISRARAAALLAHEVGAHLVTYWNGCAQPIALMGTGLAGYEQLQEGIAVLME